MDPDPSSLLPVIINVTVLLFLSALFSGAETAFTNLSPARIEIIRNDNKFASKLIYSLYNKLDLVISLCLILSNGVNIFLATYLAIFFTSLFGVDLGGTLSATVGTVLVIIFGEIMPKKIAILFSVEFSRLTAHLLNFLRIALYPVLFPILLINSLMDKIKRDDKEEELNILQQEIDATLNIGHDMGALESKEYAMMQQLLLLNDRHASEIMTHRSDIVAISADAKLRDLLELSVQNNASRIPVYEESIDHISYIIHIFQLTQLLLDERNLDKPVREFCTTPAFKIPESKIIDDLFIEFQKKRLHMAIVLDEFGVTTGLITLEDVVEQIFGEIEDETDVNVDAIKQLDDTLYQVEGDTTLEDIEEYTGYNFPDEYPKHKTIGWLILNILNRFPKEGEVLEIVDSNLRLEVVDKDGEYIDKVNIELADITEDEDDPTDLTASKELMSI